MPDVRPGRHELGQNFLTDRSVLDRIVHLVSQRPGPLVEWGTGNGAVTLALSELGRPLEGVEIDSRRAAELRRRIGPHVCIAEGDILRHAPPQDAVVVSNVPFHLTTPVLRHLLASTTWRHAVLLTQWEVARKRAGVGGTTQLTAQWWPWFTFTLDRRVPSSAFRPRPNVDGGLLLIDRRREPLLPDTDVRDFQSWVAKVFSSRGRGVAEILRRNGVPARLANQIAQRRRRSQAPVLPRDLRAEDWVAAYAAV
ncbi:23S ribosomal RNA methyltransferase Erm [Nocardioides sp. NPDC087217]|uniref:23S ribosomal RNA methyltransferase Erm n=1 Tax=Nocardioides sp. NPDC087217 TaxID=3364335 RepID=UPI0038110348